MSHNIEGLLMYLETRQKLIFFLIGTTLLLGIVVNLLSVKQKTPVQLSSNFQIIPTKALFPSITPDLLPVDNEITLIFTGDVIPARSVNSQMTKRNNFNYPFEKTADFLKKADLTIINLESPLINNCPVTDEGMRFCGDKRFVEGLIFAGVDIVGLANNHIYNYGQDGLDQTVELLRLNNISSIGTGEIINREIKGIKFSFMAYNGVAPFDQAIIPIDKDRIKRDLESVRQQSDFCVVLFHWGKEYSVYPSTDGQVAPFDPTEIGRWAVDNGADLVIGNHPHIVQGYEVYKGKPVFYALGNFIFDQMWSEETKLGYLLKVNLSGRQLSSFTFHPVKIENYSQPSFLEGEDKEKVLDQIVPILSR
jgi:poly-gamma-glutamate synthesis protein (capsule biosynthesis protein)